jgi:hypothetical protein
MPIRRRPLDCITDVRIAGTGVELITFAISAGFVLKG